MPGPGRWIEGRQPKNRHHRSGLGYVGPHTMSATDVRSRLYLVLCACFLTALLIADVTAGKFFQLGSLEVSVGVIPFPLTFVLTDLVNEYYGRKGARAMTWIGGGMLVLAFVLITIARMLPVAEGSPVPGPAFDAVFGISGRF